jgi:hypothetical protein
MKKDTKKRESAIGGNGGGGLLEQVEEGAEEGARNVVDGGGEARGEARVEHDEGVGDVVEDNVALDEGQHLPEGRQAVHVDASAREDETEVPLVRLNLQER